MKKKIIAICLIISLATVALIGGTLAYFFDNDDKAQNVFTVGNVEIALTEPGWTTGGGAADAPEVYPGEPLAKDPTVSNTGANPCFVRVAVFGLGSLTPAGLIQLRTNANGLNTINAGWVLHTDGYYYYTKPLVVPGTEANSWNSTYGLTAATTPLFNHIVIPTDLQNGVPSVNFSVDIVAQAVQAQGAKAPNWAAVNGMTVTEIAAWFTTVGMPIPTDPATP